MHGGNVVEYNSSDDVIVKNSFNETNITLNMFTSYIRITGELNILETLIVQSASQSMIENLYQSGVKRVLKEQISDYYKNGNCIVVSKDGYYNTIFKAREWILYYGGGEKYTILVMPGIYEEVVNISGLNISLVGVDKLNCIILDKSGDYYNAPINMGGGNLVKNLTIIASHENMPIGYLDEHEPSYGIHHDAEGEGKSYIEDCDIISYQSAAIGIGTQNNQQLTVKNCTLRTDTSGLPINKRERAALLAHNYPLAGASRQRLIVDNCRISSNSQFVFIAGDPNNEPTGGKDDRDSKWSFYNNIFWSDMIGKDPSIFYLIGATDVPEGDIGYIKITGDSFGNNIDVLNK